MRDISDQLRSLTAVVGTGRDTRVVRFPAVEVMEIQPINDPHVGSTYWPWPTIAPPPTKYRIELQVTEMPFTVTYPGAGATPISDRLKERGGAGG